MANGSEIRQYLKEQRQEFYYRDEEKLGRPTEEATRLVESTGR